MTQTLVTAWQAARKRLEAVGVDLPTFDARLLVEMGAGVARADILTDPRRELSDAQLSAIDALVMRREAREPISQIIGKQGFRNIELAVTRDVLTPRPDTEVLVHAAVLAIPEDKPARVLDFGVGSGAILAAILSERPLATGVGVDLSEAALLVAQSNLEALGLSGRAVLQRGDWGEGMGELFDVIVANPPYVADHEFEGLAPEVTLYEPRLALSGGADGLSAYRALAPDVARLLAADGLAAFEIGATQADAVKAILESSGLSPLTLWNDLERRPRVWTALKKPLEMAR